MAVRASAGGIVKRREDPRLVTGQGTYTGDVARGGWLHAAFAESRSAASDAAAAVLVDYEPLVAVVDAEGALAPGAPVVHARKGDNLVSVSDLGEPGALEGADVVVRARF